MHRRPHPLSGQIWQAMPTRPHMAGHAHKAMPIIWSPEVCHIHHLDGCAPKATPIFWPSQSACHLTTHNQATASPDHMQQVPPNS